MPLPSSGSISFDDLNLELGNEPGTQLDMSSSAALFSLTAPHGMDEFYGLSLLGDDFLFSDWTGGVSVNEFGVISSTLGNATDIVINTSNFGASTTSQSRIISVSVTVPNTFNGEEPSNAGEIVTGDKSAIQSAVGRYLTISADDTSLAGDDTSVSLTVTDTHYNNGSQTPWEITTETIESNSLPVISFLPITGTGTETVNVAVDDNANGSTRSVRFRVTGTIGGKSSIVDVSQASYTPVVAPTVSIDSVLPSAPFSYNGVNQVIFTISRTVASSFTAQISPGIDSNGAIFSTTQPSNITRNSSTSISGTNSTFYVQIPARTDTDEGAKTDYLTVNVSANGLGGYAPYDLSQEGYSLPVYTWGGSVIIDRDTGDVVVTNDDSAGTITISPISFNEYVTTTTQRVVTIGNIVIPSGYQNAGSTTDPQTFYPNQSAVPRTLTATPSSTTIGGSTTSIMLDINDVYYTDTSWTLTEDLDNTISNLTFSPSSGTGDSPYTVISFGSNTSGGTKYGRFTLSGGDSLIEITITQNVYVAPPSISITSVSPSGPYSYEGQGNIFVNISRSGGTNYSAQITPSFDDANATFPSLQPSGITWNNSTSLTITTGTSFKVDIPSRSDGTITTYSSNVVVNASNSGGSDSDSVSLQQTGLVTWNTSPSSLSFATDGGTQNITLNSSFSWNASVSGTGFSINTTSGNSGTNTISVTATQKDLGGSGTVTFSASGQSDIVVSLSQAAAPLEILYYINGSSSGQSSDTFTDNSISYLGESTSVGVYAYRGSTPQSTSFTLTKYSGGTYFGVSTTTSGTNTTVSSNTTQSTGASAATLYINFNPNSGNTSTRSGEVQLECGGNIVTFNLTQNSDPNAGGGGGGKTPPGPGGGEL